jgi:hypothetical protein
MPAIRSREREVLTINQEGSAETGFEEISNTFPPKGLIRRSSSLFQGSMAGSNKLEIQLSITSGLPTIRPEFVLGSLQTLFEPITADGQPSMADKAQNPQLGRRGLLTFPIRISSS